MSVAFDKSATVLAVVGTAGYAGLFAIWSWVSPYLTRSESLTAAALLGFSVLLFVLWQLYGQITFARQQMLFGSVVAAHPSRFDAAHVEYRVRNLEIQQTLRRLWGPVLTAIAVPGVLGGSVIVLASVRHLLCRQCVQLIQ